MKLRDYLYNLAIDKQQGFWACIIKAVLFFLSLFYGLVVRILIIYYSLMPHRINCKVISVGNITCGGTGKTPLVESIARYLKQKGCKIAVLTRGYKRRKSIRYPLSLPVRQAGAIRYETMGDEPAMLMNNLKDIPVIVDADRVRSAKKAIKGYGVKAVILDDGFQQWRIKKDLEIVAIDATRPFGNRHMIPRGILREPLSSLARADIFMLTKTNLNSDTQKTKDFLHSINPGGETFESTHTAAGFYNINNPAELSNTDLLRGRTVTLLSGIASPDSFRNLIANLGINVGLFFEFPDHYAYQVKDIEEIIKESQGKNIDTIITTEKDFVRIPHKEFRFKINIFVLKIELTITKNEKEFLNRIYSVFTG